MEGLPWGLTRSPVRPFSGAVEVRAQPEQLRVCVGRARVPPSPVEAERRRGRTLPSGMATSCTHVLFTECLRHVQCWALENAKYIVPAVMKHVV